MSEIQQEVFFDRELIQKYSRPGPRYTSYPTAPQFDESFGPQAFRETAAASNPPHARRDLSLYLHIPFCDTVCYYCACNKVVTPDRTRAEHYLEYLFKEIAMNGALFSREKKVMQLHLGGGTPTYLTALQLERVMEEVGRHFSLVEGDEGEYGIEVDPREVPKGTATALRKMGFNRMSVGVQDLDPAVQKAVNRIQPLEIAQRVMDEARAAGFLSLNVDLMYGLPLQTVAGFDLTLKTVVEKLNPDRLAVFNYAHLPQYFSPQRRIVEEQLPSPEDKLKILERTIHYLTGAGYVYIGMDHFAKPGDEMAVAQRQGVLHRNFQGYTTRAGLDLVGLGATAISEVGATYSQNVRKLEEYYERIGQGELAVFRGMRLSDDDLLRREVIMRLICDFQLDCADIGRRFGIDFWQTFAAERQEVLQMVEEGLLREEGDKLLLTPGGRLLIRNVCMAFDWYLRHAEQKKTFSKTI